MEPYKRYKRLFGSEPSFYPNDIEAVWQLAEDRYVYVIEAPERAGGAVSMIWVDDPVSAVAKISERRLQPVDVEKHDTVWKYVFHDADATRRGSAAMSPPLSKGLRTRPDDRAPEDLRLIGDRGSSRLGESNPGPTHYECVALTD